MFYMIYLNVYSFITVFNSSLYLILDKPGMKEDNNVT